MQKSPRLHLQFSLKNIVLKFEGDRSNGFWDICNEKKCWRQQFLGRKSPKNGSTAKKISRNENPYVDLVYETI